MSCWSVSRKKSLLRQLRQVEKHDTPARLEYYGHPKEIAKVIVKSIEQGKLRYNGEENYTQIIRSLTSVINVETGKIVSRETLLTYAKWIRTGELPEDE